MFIYWIITVGVGFFGSLFLGNMLNWTDAGAIMAIATMGVLIINEIKNKE